MICNFMIFSESVGSGACLSANNSSYKVAFLFEKGEVLEWLKRHAWKACIPLKGITSSNLVLSALNHLF